MRQAHVLHGAYPADRAAALAGMPISTLNYWARKGIIVPRVSVTRLRLWAFEDLMALRAVAWLRRRKVDAEGREIPAASMEAVRGVLRSLAELDLDVWADRAGSRVAVDPDGKPYAVTPAGPQTATGQLVGQWIDLLGPFEAEGRHGPDLERPRPRLRIIPGKLSGAPHVEETRIETEAIAALAARGFGVAQIAGLYPEVDEVALAEALDLETQLGTTLRQTA